MRMIYEDTTTSCTSPHTAFGMAPLLPKHEPHHRGPYCADPMHVCICLQSCRRFALFRDTQFHPQPNQASLERQANDETTDER